MDGIQILRTSKTRKARPRTISERLKENLVMASTTTCQVDVLLAGAGIMSAKLAVLLKELDPALEIVDPRSLGAAVLRKARMHGTYWHGVTPLFAN
jgi:hypothetical protein